MTPLSVAVFAHNEAARIRACLDSLAPAAPGRPLEVYVLANGCTDRTEAVVADYARRHPEVRLVSIGLGDKANTWNVFVHEVAAPAAAHVFVDGDVQAGPRAIERLWAALANDPHAHAAAAFPASGRSLERARRAMLEDHALAGNLYALRGEFVARVRSLGVRLPVGLVREDGLVGALAKWDLDPRRPWDERRGRPCPEATFRFEPLSPLSPAHWRLQWRRQIRYAVGGFENRMLAPLLKREGLAGLPADTRALYARSTAPLTVGAGADTFFQLIALGRIRRRRAWAPALERARRA